MSTLDIMFVFSYNHVVAWLSYGFILHDKAYAMVYAAHDSAASRDLERTQQQ